MLPDTMAETVSPYSTIHSFHLPANLLEATVQILRHEGAGQVESILFWAGTLGNRQGRVTRVLVPRGPGVFKHPLQVRVSDGIIAGLCDFIDPPSIVLLGQVHTHKFEAYHSVADDENSLDTPGYLSVVIPRFASNASGTWQEWAFCECIASKTFRQFPAAEVHERIIVEPTAEFTVHYVNG